MGGSSGGGQEVVQTGPTVAAANAAAKAQVQAAQIAAKAATDTTNSALKQLMSQYSTSLTYANPSINTGNQAAAQMNYMMGLPAISPGPSPVRPDAPTLADAAEDVTRQMKMDYINDHTNIQARNDLGFRGAQFDDTSYTGVGAHPGQQWLSPTFRPTSDSAIQSILGPDVMAQITNEAAKPILKQNMKTYNDVTLPGYEANQNQWNQQKSIYDTYSAKGIATAADINNIVQNLPGFQFQQQQGISAIQNAASASGMLHSGAILQQLNKFGQDLSSTSYNNYMGQLASMAGAGQSAMAGINQAGQNTGNTAAGLYSALGDNLGNAALASGQAMASSYLSPVANQEIRTTSVGGGGGGGGLGSILGSVGGLLSSFGGFSSRDLKDKIETPSKEEILENVKSLDLDVWKYKEITGRHIGPYAQDFHDKFKVGDGKTINIPDYLGVITASLQALADKVEKLQASKESK